MGAAQNRFLILMASLLIGAVVYRAENTLPLVIVRAIGMIQHAAKFTPSDTIRSAINKTGDDHHEITRMRRAPVRFLMVEVFANAPVCPGEYCSSLLSVWRDIEAIATTVAKHFSYLAPQKVFIEPLGSFNDIYLDGDVQIKGGFFSCIFEPQSNCSIFVFMLLKIFRGNDLLWSDPGTLFYTHFSQLITENAGLQSPEASKSKGIESDPSGESGDWFFFLKPPWSFKPFFYVTMGSGLIGFIFLFGPRRNEPIGAMFFIGAIIFLLFGSFFGFRHGWLTSAQYGTKISGFITEVKLGNVSGMYSALTWRTGPTRAWSNLL
jgi:hypothetical protein